MVKLSPTRHAVLRAKDRAGWCRKTLERMLERVYYLGLCPEDCCRQLRDYLASVGFGDAARLIRLYGDHVFVFGRENNSDEVSLITILHLPGQLRHVAHRARARSLEIAA